ncbi:RecQ family ATP-dependent DNA helicase [Oceanobacillus limi]|nr:RecQ family ATP-dependent DNA helicase [Oceanobacillus limi]
MKDYKLETELKKHFNYPSFRTGQKEIIQDVMNNKDVLGVLPTGSGKSICYQLPAKLLPGVTIVVSPLISLMEDQVKQLKASNFKEVVAINSFIDPMKRNKIYRNLNQYKLIYVSPEILQQESLVKALQNIAVDLFVIDEAHCISQWGHEFRPDYLKLKEIIRKFNNPTLLALSATATSVVQEDIIRTLDRPNFTKHIHPMDRNNIMLTVKEVSDNQEKIEVILNVLEKYQVPTLIYFSSRQITEQIASLLSQRLSSLRVSYYHGGMDQMDRIAIQQQFMNDQLDVICCTSAFGMGINKNNIRLIIHYHFPPQIEAFIQEIGRAGRDGESSLSMLLYAKSDEYIPWNMIQNELPSEQQLQSLFHMFHNEYVFSLEKESEVEQLKELLGLGETQWNFIHYQLEKHGMIDENNCIRHRVNDAKAVFNEINQTRRTRSIEKENKLRKMITWMNTDDCLREELYTSFQSSFSEPIDQCCSNCGFSFDEWKPKQLGRFEKEHENWHEKLRKLLLIGE